MVSRRLSRFTFNFREINHYYMQEMSSEGKSISNITHSRSVSNYVSHKKLFSPALPSLSISFLSFSFCPFLPFQHILSPPSKKSPRRIAGCTCRREQCRPRSCGCSIPARMRRHSVRTLREPLALWSRFPGCKTRPAWCNSHSYRCSILRRMGKCLDRTEGRMLLGCRQRQVWRICHSSHCSIPRPMRRCSHHRLGRL